MRKVAIGLVLWAIPGAATAFCGTYVGTAGTPPTNRSGVLFVAHDRGQLTLTMANDVVGTSDDFGLLIPVPGTVRAQDVSVVDTALVERVVGYTGPRLVEYTCSEAVIASVPSGGGCSGSTTSTSRSGTSDPEIHKPSTEVGVVDLFTVGAYDIALLDADREDALLQWLAAHGFVADAQLEGTLGEYIGGDHLFMAARISSDALETEGTWLSPLQITYESTTIEIPLRLGAASSDGVQDLVIVGVNGANDGQMHIRNYPRAHIEDECLYRATDRQTFSAFYERRLEEALRSPDEARWAVEYSWSQGKCDPCPPDQPDGLATADLEALGFSDPNGANVTRLHMRYSADQIDRDLSMAPVFIGPNEQRRYIVHDPKLEDYWPVCAGGPATVPAEHCVDEAAQSGLVTDPRWTGAVGLIGALLLLRRRSRR